MEHEYGALPRVSPSKSKASRDYAIIVHRKCGMLFFSILYAPPLRVPVFTCLLSAGRSVLVHLTQHNLFTLALIIFEDLLVCLDASKLMLLTSIKFRQRILIALALLAMAPLMACLI